MRRVGGCTRKPGLQARLVCRGVVPWNRVGALHPYTVEQCQPGCFKALRHLSDGETGGGGGLCGWVQFALCKIKRLMAQLQMGPRPHSTDLSLEGKGNKSRRASLVLWTNQESRFKEKHHHLKTAGLTDSTAHSQHHTSMQRCYTDNTAAGPVAHKRTYEFF